MIRAALILFDVLWTGVLFFAFASVAFVLWVYAPWIGFWFGVFLLGKWLLIVARQRLRRKAIDASDIGPKGAK